MRRYLTVSCFILAILFSFDSAKAQYYFFDADYYDNPVLYEAGASVNAMNCLTDLGGTKGIGRKFFKDLNIGFTNLSGGIFFSVSYKNAVALRLEGTFGQVSANDNVLKGITDEARERYNRNQNFRSNISEVALVTELYPTYIFIDWPAKDQSPPRTAPYIIAGVAYFSFNPQTRYGNRTIDLQPLHTEGQGFAEYPDRKEYKLNQVSIPLGVGVKYELSPIINVRGEFNYRKTFTDYIDDVSTSYIDPSYFSNYLQGGKLANALAIYDRQIEPHGGINGKRGTVTNNDGYFTFCAKISVVIGRERIHNN